MKTRCNRERRQQQQWSGEEAGSGSFAYYLRRLRALDLRKSHNVATIAGAAGTFDNHSTSDNTYMGHGLLMLDC
jgi:hypothetical protein